MYSLTKDFEVYTNYAIKHDYRTETEKIVSIRFLTETVQHFQVSLVSSHVLYNICEGVRKLRKPYTHTTQTHIVHRSCDGLC